MGRRTESDEPACDFRVERPEGKRNRLTVALRPILAAPHILLVGGPSFGLGGFGERTGAYGLLAGVCALVNWFAIVFTGREQSGLLELQLPCLQWRASVLAFKAGLWSFGENIMR